MHFRLIWVGVLVAVASSFSGCSSGPRAFTKGEYDDPTRVELLDDKFNESDMQQMADTVIKAMVACPYVTKSPKPPVVIVERVQNRTCKPPIRRSGGATVRSSS